MTHKKLYLTLAALLFCNMAHSWPSWETLWSYPKSASTTIMATLTNIYRWRQPDTSLPTLDKLKVVSFIPIGQAANAQANSSKKDALTLLKQKNIDGNLTINGTIYRVQSGIPENIKDIKNPISAYSGGYSNGGNPYAFCGYTAIKAGLMPGACVTFDFATDTRRGFNFCQQQDLHCVKTVCNEIVKKSPDASLILHGACKGAANNLRFLAEQGEADQKENCLKNIKAVISESPPISVKKALQRTPLAPVTLALMRGLFPNYNPNAKNIMQTQTFPAIPVMVASLPKDTISELDDMIAMSSHLNKNCQGRVELFVSEQAEIRHGKIGQAKDYQQAVSAFLKANDLMPRR